MNSRNAKTLYESQTNKIKFLKFVIKTTSSEKNKYTRLIRKANDLSTEIYMYKNERSCM